MWVCVILLILVIYGMISFGNFLLLLFISLERFEFVKFIVVGEEIC